MPRVSQQGVSHKEMARRSADHLWTSDYGTNVERTISGDCSNHNLFGYDFLYRLRLKRYRVHQDSDYSPEEERDKSTLGHI